METKTNLLPAHYTKVSEPSFQGKGNHSVKELEEICEQYKELTHQLRVEKQNLTEISNTSLRALNICFQSLCTYGSHPIIEKQVNNAINNATK